jgi:hypothetical protein
VAGPSYQIIDTILITQKDGSTPAVHVLYSRELLNMALGKLPLDMHEGRPYAGGIFQIITVADNQE